MGGRKIKVIVADDQKLYRDGIVSLLGEFNISVIAQAENGNILLKLLETKTPDIVLLDLEMPGLDGSKTLDAIKKKFPFVGVIIVSQYDEQELIKDFLNRGANAYISKDTDIEIIITAIKEVKVNGIYRENISALMQIIVETKKEKYKLLFSKREKEIIILLCDGKTVKEIAGELNVTEKAIEAHLTEIYKKSGVASRSHFLIYAINEGLHYLGVST